MTRFEQFTVGDQIRHARGSTIYAAEGALLSKLVMNSAQAHFNEDMMAGTPFGGPLVFGLLTASIVIGLATQDTAEDALAERALDKLRFTAPVSYGDTLYASTEVLETAPAEREDAGLVRFKHWGYKTDGTIVFEGERTVLLKRESHYPIGKGAA